ncbi:MAG: DUF1648 domain-containing protein [Lachnospiraceae bacterium]|nr:DUF1648 domain-containing protein [Lachnospiraceae bacterium]MBR5732626.1 DUF1648 domain-containing protein [Lachnospiraceae bacterium]
MKKALWIVTFIPLVVTAVLLQYLPEKIPMHFDGSGNIDRWGSKFESFLIPFILIALALMMTLIARYYEKKASETSDEKEREAALSNSKVILLVGLIMNVITGVMQGLVLYTAFTAAGKDITESPVDFGKMTCFVLGLGFIILGNVMTKTRNNGAVGVRTVWSRYNDNTWRKSNRFGGIVLMAAGVLTMISTALVKTSGAANALMMVWLGIVLAATIVYSHKVYKDEIAAEKAAK